MRRRSLAFIMILLSVGCGSSSSSQNDAGHVGPGESCTAIVEACHPVDVGTGEISVCHDLGHSGPSEMCDARRVECVALCTAAASDGGHLDAAVAESDAAVANICTMLGSLCHHYDTGSGPAHECHEVGHAGDLAACEAMAESCMTICSGDAGSHSHDEDAGEHAHDEDAGAHH